MNEVRLFWDANKPKFHTFNNQLLTKYSKMFLFNL